MDSETKGWLGCVACAAVFLSIFAFTAGGCQQNADKLATERFNACVQAGGTWIQGDTSAKSNCLAR